MRIAIVNDMFMAVEAMRRVLMSAHPPQCASHRGRACDCSYGARAAGHQIAWIARDGVEAVERCLQDRPDLILMDLIMPRMDGVEATRQIMARTPCAIVVVTANVDNNTSKVFEAMGAGALDAVNTPVLSEPGNLEGAKALLSKIETISRLIGPIGTRPETAAAPVARSTDFKHDRLVAIGASAGGPAALAKVLSALPADFPAAVVIVQHVDEHFAPGLADWLQNHSLLRVRLAEERDRPCAGTVYLAAKEHHLVLASPTHLGYTRHPTDCSYRPSVDVFFKSVDRYWPVHRSSVEGGQDTVVGVLLTGMGRDGAEGLKALRDRGHCTIAQDEATCAVYGMPKAAAELDAATEILPLDKIGPRLTNMLQSRVQSVPRVPNSESAVPSQGLRTPDSGR